MYRFAALTNFQAARSGSTEIPTESTNFKSQTLCRSGQIIAQFSKLKKKTEMSIGKTDQTTLVLDIILSNVINKDIIKFVL